MHIVITGANGFVGKALAQRIAQMGELGGQAVTRLSLLDLSFDKPSLRQTCVNYCAGDLTDDSWLKSVLSSQSLDIIFHLASIPGGSAEKNYKLARAVNLDSTLTLLESAKDQVESAGLMPVFVFASSIAVYGKLTEHVTDDTALHPQMTYASQKIIGEVLVEDFSRRGWVDGRSLRLPGVLARPPAPTGQLSAFLSDIIRALAAGQQFTCPTSPTATTWASSLPCMIENLLHAATASIQQLAGQRTFNLPTLCFSMQQLVEALVSEYPAAEAFLVNWQPEELIENLFGRFPTLETPAADKAGFRHDGDLRALVRNALVES